MDDTIKPQPKALNLALTTIFLTSIVFTCASIWYIMWFLDGPDEDLRLFILISMGAGLGAGSIFMVQHKKYLAVIFLILSAIFSFFIAMLVSGIM